MLSPHLLHPTAFSCASFVEYNNGLIPILYKLSPFDKFTKENLKEKKINTNIGIFLVCDTADAVSLPLNDRNVAKRLKFVV